MPAVTCDRVRRVKATVHSTAIVLSLARKPACGNVCTSGSRACAAWAALVMWVIPF